MENDDPVDDGCPNEQNAVEEADEIALIIKQVVDSEGRAVPAVYDRYKAILHKYQEQSQLLDSFLEDIVVPLASLLRRRAVLDGAAPTTAATGAAAASAAAPDASSVAADEAATLSRVQDVCRLLAVLVAVRGYKTVVKFFPHEAADLEKVLDVLQRVRASNPRTEEDCAASWEAQTILLLWLSILILIPFELSTVDSADQSAGDTGGGRRQPYTVLVAKLLLVCQEYLRHPGGAREMAALLLGRLLTRPDMSGALSDFLRWSSTAVQEAAEAAKGLHEPFLACGVLQTLSFVFKLGQRQRLLPHAPAVWAHASALLTAGPGSLSTNALARKLAIKLTQRLGLTFLEPRLAPWRYLKDDASLDNTLGAGMGETDSSSGAQPSAAVQAAAAEGSGGGEEGEEEGFEVAEQVEEVIERLLEALRDKDTIVRWSAAKGVGRITGCLPKELGDEIVESVVVLIKPTESDTAWHGSCLALAELARRGLLMPSRLPTVVPLIRTALHYDVRRGPHSVGAHVRDAAAYVCWAFARAYAPEVLADGVNVLAASLLTIACYDREVNCRRATAAAFQEAVGRLGNFPHGMDILHVADYFSVGNVNQAYLKVAPFIAGYPEYRSVLPAHLLSTKLRHWDKPLRELAAQALAALVPTAPEFFATDALDELLPLCLDPVLEVRHGAVLGMAALLPALQAAGVKLEAAREAKVAGIVPAIDKARLYRGKGGEMLREAVGHLIGASAAAHLPLNKTQHAKAMEALDENLKHPQAAIQTAAVAALRQYASAYACTPGEVATALQSRLGQFASRLSDPNVAVRRGYSLALGALPAELMRPVAEQVLDALTAATALEEDADQRDVESRVNAIRAAGQLCTTLYGGGTATAGAAAGGSGSSSSGPATASQGGNSLTAAFAAVDEDRRPQPLVETEGVSGIDPHGADLMLNKLVPVLCTALEDYTTDNRGDVGSWVREAAMAVLTDLVPLVSRCLPTGDAQRLQDLVALVAGCLIKQAVERIARVREFALRHLKRLLERPAVAALMPGAADVAAAMPKDDAELIGVASVDTIPRLVALLVIPQYTAPLLEGLAASVGGVDASLSKAASSALCHVMQRDASASGGGRLVGAVAQLLLTIWRRHAKSSRLATPLLRIAHLLVTRYPAILDQQVTVPLVPPPAADAIPAASTPAAAATAAAAAAPIASAKPSEPPAPLSSTATAAVSAAPESAAGPAETARDSAGGTSGTGGGTSGAGGGTSRGAPPPPSTSRRFSDEVVELVRAETRQCGDVTRLLEAAALLCQLTGAQEPCRSSALQGLLVLLVSRYPRVRRHAAEQLYLQLLSADDGGDEARAQAQEAASDLLLATTWDGELDSARSARDELAATLGVAVPKMVVKGGGGGAAGARGGGDALSSYQSLLDDAARQL